MNVAEPQVDPEVMTWEKALQVSIVSSVELATLPITPREMIIGGFCFEGDLGFIFAARGVGKTWLGMYLAKCIALGQKAKRWEVPSSVKVLYIDGEMPPADVKARDMLLGVPSDKLCYLNHEILFERSGLVINLSDKDFQDKLLERCELDGTKMVILDNLSTLASGIDENNGVEWDAITPFLMRLRRAHITVIFIHHAGRNGQMRGHSKREDPSAWILKLEMPQDALEENEGAHFISRFTKWRNASKCPAVLEWMFRPQPDGTIDIKVDTASSLEIFRQLIESGVNTNKDLAVEMNCTPGYISQLAKKAKDEGWLEIKGKTYSVTSERRHYSAHSDA